MREAATADAKRVMVARWNLTPDETAAIEQQDPQWIKPLAISLRLSALLGDDMVSELRYLAAPRERFLGWSARTVIANRSNGLDQVMEMVESETP